MDAIIALRVIRTVTSVLGILGNGLVCLVIVRVRAMHTLTNGLVLNQAVVDLLGSVLTFLEANAGAPDRVPSGLAGELYCRLWFSKFFIWACFASSTFSLASLTMERYLAIVFPFKYRTVFTKTKAVVVVLVVWILGLVASIYNLIYLRSDDKGSCVSVNVSGSQMVGLLLFISEYALPVGAMLCAYIHIILVLKRSANRVGVSGETRFQQAGARGRGKRQDLAGSLVRARTNVFKTLFIVFCSFVICWTPNKIIFLMFNFGWPLDFNGYLYVISVALVATNGFINPVIYALKYRQFRRGMLVLLGRSPPVDADATSAQMRSFQNGDQNTAVAVRDTCNTISS